MWVDVATVLALVPWWAASLIVLAVWTAVIVLICAWMTAATSGPTPRPPADWETDR